MTEILSARAAQNFIGGKWSQSESGETYEKRNPWRPSEVTGVFAASTSDDARAAVGAAHDAFPAWAALPAPARAAFLFRAADAIEARVERIAKDMTAEMGKPLREARMEAARAAMILRYSAGEAYRPAGEVYEPSVGNQTLYTRRRPIGVVGLITPWNFPVAIPVWKLAPALIYGNTVVLKLGYEAPRTGLHIAECFAETGLPPGVLNVVTGAGSKVGAELVSNRHVRALSFTGSVAVGHAVRNEATARNCRVQLELGGHNPFIVMADAELDRAAEAAFAGAFWSAGQKCTATRRILVQDTVYDAFAAKLAERVAKLRIGNGLEPGVTTGPLIDEAAVKKVEEHVADAVAKGAKIMVGGKRHALGGLFFEPTILTNVNPSMKVTREETFGPVAPLFRFKDEAEAIRMANDTEFGLAAYFYARDMGRVWRVAEGLESGIVGINTGLISTAEAPFGGVKESGLGREGSKYGIEDYLEVKYLCMSV